MRSVLAPLMIFVAACGGDSYGGDTDPCTPSISFTPASPIAGPLTEVRATGFVSDEIYGVRSYTWTVRRNGASVPFDPASVDDSQISFIADLPGTYTATLGVQVSGYQCSSATDSVTARATDDNSFVRLQIVPPPSADAPPHDEILELPDSPDLVKDVTISAGTTVTGTVVGGATGVPAYLRFIPVGAEDAAVETFADAAGTYSVRVASRAHDVLIVPGGGFAPTKKTWSPGLTGSYAVTTGSSVSGTVRDPAGAALAGAKVQLVVNGVPSTLATTAADGTYAVQVADTGAGSDVEVEVVPPAATGLPRLEVFGALSLSSAIDVRYASTLVTRDLAGLQLRRSSSPLANAKLTVVGALSSAGTIGGMTATGTVRVAATANGTGVLPATLVTAGPLSGVIAAAPTDLTVVPFDLTSSVPSTLTAPSMVSLSTIITDGAAALDGAQVQLVPRDALARAGASSIYLTAGATGMVSGLVASGGTYDLLMIDPVGRAAARFERDVTAATVAASYTLPEAQYVTGQVSVQGQNRLVGASVQILCTVCEGIDRARPLAEGATDQAGGYTLAVPRPGAL